MAPNDVDTEVEKKKPVMEVSMEDASSAEQLKDLLNRKSKEKLEMANIKGLNVLKKSKFYYNADGQLREHIATYNGYAILIKQEKIKEETKELKEYKMFPSLIKIAELKGLKKVNGNVVRKIQPESVHEYQKMALIQGVIFEIDKGL